MKKNNQDPSSTKNSFADRDWGRAVKASGAIIMAAAALVATKARPASADSVASGNRVTAIAGRGDSALTSAEKGPKLQIFPTGVKPSDTLYTYNTDSPEIFKDIQEAEMEHKYQWTGLIEITVPTKKPGQVSLSEAPRSYNELLHGDYTYGYDPERKAPRSKQFFLYKPLMFMHQVGKHKRLFAQINDFGKNGITLSVDVGLLSELGAGFAYSCDKEDPRLIDVNKPQPAGSVVIPSLAGIFNKDNLTAPNDIKVFAPSDNNMHYCTPLGNDALSKIRLP